MTRTKAILDALKERYPNPQIALVFRNPIEVLAATILSAQCTDARVNIVTRSLFKKYKTVEDYARAKPKTLEQEIRSTGFYRNKAQNIIAAARKIAKDFRGRVPETMEGLLTLPGVARKTANVVLYNAFCKNEGIAVDTHVLRLSRRLGLTLHDDPVKVERDLMEIVDRREWGRFSLRLIVHGRNTCIARSPRCAVCVLRRACPSKKRFYPAFAENPTHRRGMSLDGKPGSRVGREQVSRAPSALARDGERKSNQCPRGFHGSSQKGF